MALRDACIAAEVLAELTRVAEGGEKVARSLGMDLRAMLAGGRSNSVIQCGSARHSKTSVSGIADRRILSGV